MFSIRNCRRPALSTSRRARPRLETLEDRTTPATFTVVNTLASGPGSLAQAIADSNQTPGANLIRFDIAGTGQQTIRLPLYRLDITNSVTIDGFSQPGSSPNTLAQGDNAVTNIVLDGEGTGCGLYVGAADVTIQGLTIQNFHALLTAAITSYADNTVIQGNFILNNNEGVMVGGLNALVGGTTPDARNVISANREDGIMVWDWWPGDHSTSLYATIENNFIGTDATGTVADTNWQQQGGIWQQNGVDLQTSNNVVTHNLISGNGLDGVVVGGDHNTISANLVGTDVTGTKVLGNGYMGVEIGGGSSSNNYIGGGNVLSGNAVAGVGTSSSGCPNNTIQGDYIGTDATGQLNLGNGKYGVFIFGTNNFFGGPDPGQGNVIAFNGQGGVYVFGTDPLFGAWTYGNLIETDSIFANGGLGIALVGNANNGAAAPQLTSAVREGNSYVVSGTLHAPPGTYTLEFFANPDASAEGKTFLGRIAVKGQASFSVALPALPGVFITATATDASNNTSQFSNSVPITVPSPSSPNMAAIKEQLVDQLVNNLALSLYDDPFHHTAAGNALGALTALHHDLPDAAPVRDLVFLPQQGNASPAGALSKAAYGGAGEGTTADVQGIRSGDRDADHDADGARSEGEASLSGRAVPLVDEQDGAVAETRTGAEGANRFVGVPAGRYQAEAEPSPEWAGAVAGAFTVGTEPVALEPLGLPSAGNAGEEGALPAGAGVPSSEGTAPPDSTAADAYWALLGAILPIFHSRKDRRSAASAARHWAC
jgi:hypothetical protein